MDRDKNWYLTHGCKWCAWKLTCCNSITYSAYAVDAWAWFKSKKSVLITLFSFKSLLKAKKVFQDTSNNGIQYYTPRGDFYHCRQYFPYHQWNLNLNFISDSLFLSHSPSFPIWHINLSLFCFLFFSRWILHIFTSRIYIYNIYYCHEEVTYYLDN